MVGIGIPPKVEALPARRANTVEFFAGFYTGNGAAGQNSNTDQTFAQFNWSLAEDNVVVTNAYILVELDFESYSNTNAYTGYELAFDTCVEACAANAFGGVNIVNDVDGTNLAGSEQENNVTRIISDVTAEGQLAAYTGGGTNMEAQVGYRVNRAAAANSISTAMAKLVITYEFDAYSTNLTNTVVYPLDSSELAADVGSRTTAEVGACTLNVNCPLFDYNVVLDEAAVTRLDAWFTIHFQIDLSGGSDRTIFLDIQGDDTASTALVKEHANGGAQGNGRTYFWSVDNDPLWTAGAAGFVEDAAQVLEISLSGNQWCVLGGTVTETYTTARSQATKTKTVRYPIGEIQPAASTVKATQGVDVYLPETGVDIKAAFFKIKTSVASNAVNMTVTTTVGAEAESGNTVYAFNAPNTTAEQTIGIVHIITAAADITELEKADATTPVNVSISTTSSNATQLGGTSAELYVTYSYTDDNNAWMASLSHFAGQQMDAPDQNFATAATLIDPTNPETTGTKTIRGAYLDTTALFSDSDGVVSGADVLMDADLFDSGEACSTVNAFASQGDIHNQKIGIFKDVSFEFDDLTDTYGACVSNNGAGDASGGGKHNAILNYLYQWERGPLKGAVMVVD